MNARGNRPCSANQLGEGGGAGGGESTADKDAGMNDNDRRLPMKGAASGPLELGQPAAIGLGATIMTESASTRFTKKMTWFPIGSSVKLLAGRETFQGGEDPHQRFGGLETARVDFDWRGLDGGRLCGIPRIAAQDDQHGKRPSRCLGRMGMRRRQVHAGSDMQALPASVEKKVAITLENLHPRTPATGMGGKFLAGGEGELHDTKLGCQQVRAPGGAVPRAGRSFRQGHCSGVVPGQERMGRNAHEGCS